MEKEIDAARDMFQKPEQAQQLLTATESTAKAQREAEAKKFESFTTSMDARIDELVSGVSAQLAKATAAHQVALTTQLQEFTAKSDAAVAGFVAESEASLDAGDEEFKRLAEHLNELEEQVEEAMRRATGLSLSHAFQRRQLEIVEAKTFWRRALAMCVGLLLTAVGYLSQAHSVETLRDS